MFKCTRIVAKNNQSNCLNINIVVRCTVSPITVQLLYALTQMVVKDVKMHTFVYIIYILL